MIDKYRRASQHVRHHADGGQGHGVAGRSSATSEAAHRALKYPDEQHEQGLEPIHQKLHSHFRLGRPAPGANLSPEAGRRMVTRLPGADAVGIADPSCRVETTTSIRLHIVSRILSHGIRILFISEPEKTQACLGRT